MSRYAATYHEPVSGFPLGQWVSVQRGTTDAMSPEHRQRLEALGFAGDPLAAQWEEGVPIPWNRISPGQGDGLVPEAIAIQLQDIGWDHGSIIQRTAKDSTCYPNAVSASMRLGVLRGDVR